MRISRVDASLIEACAKDHQVTPRSVRTWRLRSDPRWTIWLSKREGEEMPEDHLQKVEAMAATLTPEDEVAQAARRYLVLTERCDLAIARGDQAVVVPLLRSCGEAHRLLQTTREHLRENREADGRLVDREAAFALAHEVVTRLREEAENLPAALGFRIANHDRDGAMMLLDEWSQRFIRSAADLVARIHHKFPRASVDLALDALGGYTLRPLDKQMPAGPAPAISGDANRGGDGSIMQEERIEGS